MIILGVDPGTATTGYGLIKVEVKEGNNNLKLVEYGCIQTSSSDLMPRRLLALRENLNRIIKVHKPDCMVVEHIFFGRNVRTALSVGQARGVIMLVTAENNLPVYEYTSLQVKLALAKHGRAGKEDVQKAVTEFLGNKELPKPKDQYGKNAWSFRDNAYDAAATAIYHAQKIK